MHGRCRDKSNQIRWVLTDSGSLVTCKEKQSVFGNRSAHSPAELVTFYRVPLESEGIPRIEHSIPHKFKQIAMNLIRARFCDKADRTGRFATACRSRGAVVVVYLLQGIGIWCLRIAAALGVSVRGPIQSENHSA